jgi:hypothetical protein
LAISALNRLVGFNYFPPSGHLTSRLVDDIVASIFARAFSSPIVRSPRSLARSGSHQRQIHSPSSVSVVMYDPQLQSGIASIDSGPIVKNRKPGGGSIGLMITAAGWSGSRLDFIACQQPR